MLSLTIGPKAPDNRGMFEDYSITRLQDYIGKKVEIIAFNISYMGILEDINFETGTLKIVDGEDFAILELERVESFSILNQTPS